MPRTKTLKQLANDFEVSSKTLGRWLRKNFPYWYITNRSEAKRRGKKYPNKRTYTPKEIKLIYEYYGEPNET